MGSFANSLHVKSEDSRAVVDAVKDFWLARGFSDTDRAPDRFHSAVATGVKLVAINVSEAHDGWVSLLCSDMGMEALAKALSKKFETHSLLVCVNDSDSWLYELYQSGQPIDSFDSSGERPSECSLPDLFRSDDPEIQSLPKVPFPTDTAAFRKMIDEGRPQFEQLMQNRMPPEIRELHARIQAGNATPEEAKKYKDWESETTLKMVPGLKSLKNQMKGAFEKLKQMDLRSGRPQPGAFSPEPVSPLETGAPPNETSADAEAHVKLLRPLLAQNVTMDQLRDAMGRRAVFAEESLETFLPLIGISPRYAYLAYDYLDDHSEEELAADSIRLVRHLKFRKT